MKIIIGLFRFMFNFIFWAPSAMDIPLLEKVTPATYLKMLAGTIGTAIGVLSTIFILIGNDKDGLVQLGIYGLILYTILGLFMLLFYYKYHGELTF